MIADEFEIMVLSSCEYLYELLLLFFFFFQNLMLYLMNLMIYMLQ